LQNRSKEAYRAYQSVALFELGPAEQELLRANLNTFPADVNQINANIGAGTYDLATASNLDAKGLSGPGLSSVRPGHRCDGHRRAVHH
jgi:hypothetical protein